MGHKFCNINASAYVKPVSRVNNANRVTTLKKNLKRKKVSLTADNLAFLCSLNAI